MDKYRNKYRIPSARASFWNYSNNGAYFITICTANRECLFGDIDNNTMVLSPIGEIVICEWDKSFEIRSELFCDAFVLMPPKSISSFVAGFKSSATKNINEYRNNIRRDARPCVWQSRFQDHIIRDDAEYQRIYDYIETNSQNWENDKFFKSGKIEYHYKIKDSL